MKAGGDGFVMKDKREMQIAAAYGVVKPAVIRKQVIWCWKLIGWFEILIFKQSKVEMSRQKLEEKKRKIMSRDEDRYDQFFVIK